MRVLAVNTATADRFVALGEDGALAAFAPMPDERSQVSDLVPLIAGMVDDFSRLDGFAVVTGPGSFTGVRIGMAALTGMALAAGRPLVGMTAFDMYARAAGNAEAGLLVAVDSRRDELYYQIYNAGGGAEGHPFMSLPATLPRGSGVIVAGDGALASAAAGDVRPVTPEAAAGALLAFAGECLACGNVAAPHPFYVRPPDITMPAGA